jgi:hypothetical protein
METIVPKITAFLLDALAWMCADIMNGIVKVFNGAIYIFCQFVKGLVLLFPPNPCSSLIASCTDVATQIGSPATSSASSAMWTTAINTLAWLVPVQFLATLVSCAMMSIMIYFSVAALMRWAKLLS